MIPKKVHDVIVLDAIKSYACFFCGAKRVLCVFNIFFLYCMNLNLNKMKKTILKISAITMLIVAMSSCSSYNHSMREPNSRVTFTKADFELSDQVSAEAQTVKVFGIDFPRLFTKKTGNVEGSGSISASSIPVIGNMLADRTSDYALYELMQQNEGYDVIFYPQYEKKVFKPVLGIGFITKITNVKTTARLGKLNK